MNTQDIAAYENEMKTYEVMMSQFYDPSSTNELKYKLQEEFDKFGEQDKCWVQCCYNLENSRNQYLLMFSLNTMEMIINKKWEKMTLKSQETLREAIFNHIVMKHDNYPKFMISKMVKLLVDIARNDWPVRYPNFIDHIIQLLMNPDQVLLGLSFLLLSSEEFISPKEDLLGKRKQDLRVNFLKHIPKLFEILSDILKNAHKTSNLDEVYEAVTKVFSDMFTWLPFEKYLTQDLLHTLLPLAKKENATAINTLTIFNEVLSKSYTQTEDRYYILSELCIYTFQLVENIVAVPDIGFVSEAYLTILTEILSVVIRKYWNFLDNHFPNGEFLDMLLQFTFQHFVIDCYYQCLDIWCGIFEALSDRPACVEKYRRIFLDLVVKVTQKMNTYGNFNDEIYDDDGQTECQIFLNKNIEIISNVAHLYPDVSISVVDNWKIYINDYITILNSPMLLENFNNSKCMFLVPSTRTLTSLSNYYEDSMKIAITKMLNDIAIQGVATTPLYQLPVLPSTTKTLIQIQSEILTALSRWMHLLNNNKQFCMEQNREKLFSVLVNSLQDTSQPTQIHDACGILLPTVTEPMLTHISEYTSLLELLLSPFLNGSISLNHLHKKTRLSVRVTSLKFLLTCPSQEEEIKVLVLMNYLKSLAPSGLNDLKMLTDVLVNSGPYKMSTRRIIYRSIEPFLVEAVTHLKNDMQSETSLKLHMDRCERVITFLSEIYELLHDTMSPQFVQVLMQTFVDLDIIWSASMTLTIKMLEVLSLIVKNSSKSNKEFTSAVIKLALEKLIPLVASNCYPPTVPALFNLLYCILMYKWRYFFPSAPSMTMNSNNGNNIDNSEQFTTILEVVGYSFMTNDISIFSQNLRAIEELHSKWNLYAKDYFKHYFLSKYMTVLLNIMVNKSHTLLCDEISVAIYNMASVNFEYFFSKFLPDYLKQTDNIRNDQRQFLRQKRMQPVKELPTFVANLAQLTNDIRCSKQV
ncbi:exportin-6-A [Adelges cooleyi]|uniref:exportin-6-A n=1 Tax=Adelges cooleyi TaxID=133065 RepID=UPI00217FB2E4|nr:exportin-6-A [Adelges cooleyi]